MTMSRAWRRNKAANKKTRPSYKLKIRWETFGLTSPDASTAETPIETIRRGISAMASEGFSPDTRARTEAHGKTSARPSPRTVQKPAIRRNKMR